MVETNGSWMRSILGERISRPPMNPGRPVRFRSSSGSGPTTSTRSWARLAATFPPCGRVAMTTTAELCDCYPTKVVGVNAVLDATLAAFRERPVHVWGTDGSFHSVEAIRRQPLLAAAANWLGAGECRRSADPGRAGHSDRYRDDDHGLDTAPRRPGRRARAERHRAVADRRVGLRRGAANPLAPWRPSCRSAGCPRVSPPSSSPRPSTST